MLRSPGVVVAVSCLAACTDGPAPNATLADLGGLSMSVEIWEARNDEPTAAFIQFSYDEAAFRAAHGDECAVVDSFDVSFPGARVLSKSRGANDYDFDDCYAPSVELAISNFGD